MAFQTPLQKLVLTPQSGSSGTGIICAFWVNGKEKKKQSSTAESESLYCCFWSWGDTRLSRSRCSFLCPQTAWPSLADSLLWPPFFFLPSNFPSVQSRLSNQSRVRRLLHVRTRVEPLCKEWKNVYISQPVNIWRGRHIHSHSCQLGVKVGHYLWLRLWVSSSRG